MPRMTNRGNEPSELHKGKLHKQKIRQTLDVNKEVYRIYTELKED